MSNTPYVEYTICRIHHMSNTPYIEYTICRIHHMSNTPHAEYTTCRIHHMSNTPHVEYTTCRIHHMSNTPYVEYTTCRISHIIRHKVYSAYGVFLHYINMPNGRYYLHSSLQEGVGFLLIICNPNHYGIWCIRHILYFYTISRIHHSERRVRYKVYHTDYTSFNLNT